MNEFEYTREELLVLRMLFNGALDASRLGDIIHRVNISGFTGINKQFEKIRKVNIDTGLKISDTKRKLKKQGIYVGGRKPFGYDVVDGKLVENGLEQKAIKWIKNERSKNGTPYRIISEKVKANFNVSVSFPVIRKVCLS